MWTSSPTGCIGHCRRGGVIPPGCKTHRVADAQCASLQDVTHKTPAYPIGKTIGTSRTPSPTGYVRAYVDFVGAIVPDRPPGFGMFGINGKQSGRAGARPLHNKRRGDVDLAIIMEQMLILVLIMAAGFVARRMNIIDGDTKGHLTRLLLKLTLPAAMLASTTGGSIDVARNAVFGSFAMIVFSFLVMTVLSCVMVWLFRTKKEERGTYASMALFGNSNFMGLPLIYAFFGQTAMLYGILYNIVFNLMLFSLGMKQIGGQSAKISFQFFISPLMIASVLAVSFFMLDMQLPRVIHSSIHLIGSITTPASMLLLGAMLGEMSFKVVLHGARVHMIVLTRLIVMPALVYVALLPFAIEPLLLQVIFIMSATPMAISMAMFAINYDKHQEIVAKGIFLSTMLSVITMPLIMLIFF